MRDEAPASRRSRNSGAGQEIAVVMTLMGASPLLSGSGFPCRENPGSGQRLHGAGECRERGRSGGRPEVVNSFSMYAGFLAASRAATPAGSMFPAEAPDARAVSTAESCGRGRKGRAKQIGRKPVGGCDQVGVAFISSVARLNVDLAHKKIGGKL